MRSSIRYSWFGKLHKGSFRLDRSVCLHAVRARLSSMTLNQALESDKFDPAMQTISETKKEKKIE